MQAMKLGYRRRARRGHDSDSAEIIFDQSGKAAKRARAAQLQGR